MHTLYICRLGETENNLKKVCSGQRVDSPLTHNGKAQSIKLSEFLSKRNISAIYSSPMPRVIETATPLATELGIEIVPIHEFQEADLGDFDGRALKDVAQTEDWKKFLLDPINFSFPGAGNSLETTQKQAIGKIQDIVSKYPDKDSIAVYTHGVTMRLILSGLIGTSSLFWKVRVDNCATAHLAERRDGDWELVELLNFDGIQLPKSAGVSNRTTLPKVTLWPVTDEDWPNYKNRRLDPDVVFWMASPLPVDESRLELERKRFNGTGLPNQIFLAIGDEDGHPIGNVRLSRKDGQDHTGPRTPYERGVWDFGIGLDKEKWNHGYGTSAVMKILEFAFREKGAERLECQVWDRNKRAIRCFEKADFLYEGKCRHMKYNNGAWRDYVFMAILRDEYESLQREGTRVLAI